jgi:predicted TIM-barrel enzyme
MTRAGADVIVTHMGLTTSGTIGAQTTLTLDDSVVPVRDFGRGCTMVVPLLSRQMQDLSLKR